MWLSCRECHILVPGGALVYIGARNISALLWRDQGADVENRRMVFRFPSSSFNAHTIPCAMPAFFHYLLHVSLHLLKFFLLSLLQAESSSHKVPFLQRGSIGFPQKSIGNHHLKQWPHAAVDERMTNFRYISQPTTAQYSWQAVIDT